MVDRAVAHRYAEAFVNELERASGASDSRSHTLEAGLEELGAVAGVYAGSKDLQRFLGSPEIGTEEKEQLLNRIWSDAAGKETMALLHLLLKWDRTDHLLEIFEEARSVAEERQGILRGSVTTAHAISSVETELLAQAVGKALKKKVTLERRVDRNLLGGVRVTVGSKLLDGSLRTFLEEVRQQLKAVKVD